MSRGADDIIAEYLMRNSMADKEARIVAEEIEEALETEKWMAVPKDCCLMFAPTEMIELELSRRALAESRSRG